MREENFIISERWKNQKDRTRVMAMSVHWVHKEGEWQQVRTELVWRKIKIRKSLDEVCHYLEMEMPVSEREKIDKHDRIEIRVYNPYISQEEDNFHCRRITTVLIDNIAEHYDSHSQSLTVIGRSPARDIIDSAWSDRIIEPTLEEAAQKAAEPFGIRIDRESIGSPPTDHIFQFSWESESPWGKLINECDSQGFIFTSSEDGSLYLWKVATSIRHEREGGEEFSGTTFFHLSVDPQKGHNIREIEILREGSGQFHEYVAKGNFMEKKVLDEKCKSHRKLEISLSDNNISEIALERRAITEKRRRQGNKINVTVDGWGLTELQIKKLGNTKGKEIFWNPNFLVPVDFPFLNYNEQLLISTVEHTAGLDGMTSVITLVDKEVYY